MKIKTIALLTMLVIIISGCTAPPRSDSTEKNDANIQNSILKKNREVDNEIERMANSGAYNFQNPLVITDPYGDSPLSAIIAFISDEAAAIRVTVVGDKSDDSIVFDFPASSAHYLPIIGLYAGRNNEVVLEQISNGQAVRSNILSVETEPLPKELHDAISVQASQDSYLPGITFVSGGAFRNPYAFDSSGNIRWYLRVQTDPHGFFPLSNGRFILISGYSMIETDSREYATDLYEMDYMGKLYKVCNVPKGVHHEVVEKGPGGNLLVLSNTLEGHVEDMVVEIDRKSGTTVRALNLNDVLNGDFRKAYDWAHVNSICYNQQEDTVILSVRDLSSAVKIDWASGQIIWIMADPAIWVGTEYEKYVLRSTGPNLWFYEQHAVSEAGGDMDNDPDTLDIMLFDNRLIRNEPIDIDNIEDAGRSSVSCFAVSEKKETVTQIKRFPNSFAYITSNCQLFLDQDRLFANHGSLREGQSQSLWGEIYEYKFTSGELLRTYITRYGFYRAYRMDCSTLTSQWVINDTDL